MNDIIDLLRDRKRLCLAGVRPLVQACEAAADEIARLRKIIDDWSRGMGFDAKDAEIVRLRAALAEAESWAQTLTKSHKINIQIVTEARDEARAALAEAERERDVAREPLIAVATRRELKEAIARAERAEADLAEVQQKVLQQACRIDDAREVLEIIAGQRQCIDNLMSHAEIARAFLERAPVHPKHTGGMMTNPKHIVEIFRLRTALAEETKRADREAAEVTTQVEARREIEVALAKAERERDEARDDRLRYRCQVNALEQLGIAAEEAWTEKLKHIEVDLAAAREVIERAYKALSINTVTRPAEDWHREAHVKATAIIGAFLERTAMPQPEPTASRGSDAS
jgi:hypothetical protein